MEIKTMTLEQVEERKAQIATELDNEDVDVMALKEEVDQLEARAAFIAQEVETRNALINTVKKVEDVKVVEVRQEEKNMENKKYDLGSKEYRSAFFKDLVGQDMTVEERAAFTEVTTSFGGALPTEVSKEITSLIEEEFALLHDITTFQVPTALEFTVHKSIKAGDAKVVVEAKGNDDEQNEFGKVRLVGKHFSKHVEISYDLSAMNGQGLDGYLQQEIAERLGLALNKEVVAQIEKDMEAGNKIEAKAANITYDEVLKAFGAVKGKSKSVYVSNEVLYNQLAALKDGAGHLIFQPSFNDGISGYLLGAPVRIDETVKGVLIGDPKAVKGNYVMPIALEADRDIKRGTNIYAGHTRFECALLQPKAFAKLTPKSGE